MVSLDWRVEIRDGTTLVELLVENSANVARRVRIGNRLDGPVWPPRREGVFESGWDGGGFEGIVAAGGRLALGYASPAQTTEPPAEVVWSERAASDEGGTERTESDRCATERAPGARSVEKFRADSATTPDGVVRVLGDGRPPADAVPVSSDHASAEPELPELVESWLTTVERRVERAASTASVEGNSSETPVEPTRLACDRETCLAVAERAEQLAKRAAEIERSHRATRRKP